MKKKISLFTMFSLFAPSFSFAAGVWEFNDDITGLPLAYDPNTDPAPSGYFSPAELSTAITDALTAAGALLPALTFEQGQEIGYGILAACVSALCIGLIYRAFVPA